LGLFGRGKTRERGRRILFATDVHGSDSCFRKFINAGALYEIDYLILGGDITGKMLVPIVKAAGGFDCRYGEDTLTGLSDAGVAELVKRIRGHGHYAVVVTPEELVEIQSSEERRDEVFRAAVIKACEEWVALAEERLRGTGRRCFMAPGNDDFLSIDAALSSSDVVEFAENRMIELDDGHQMITTGYSNLTPWATERELPEDELRARIDGMAQQVSAPHASIAVLHPPPHHSGLDDAPALDSDLAMDVSAAGVAMAPVGSTAVREFIEEFQPLLSLHGHVHEGRGTTRIGRTLCLNPGSDYTAGTLSAAIIEIGHETILTNQFISG
jgi:Icc-related predicted phosphoesterase